MKRKLTWLLMGILAISGVFSVNAAEKTQREVRMEYQELQKNLAWMSEGLTKLAQSKDRNLTLTKDQKQKLLPLFKELVKRNIVITKSKQRNQEEGQNGGRERRQVDENDPQVKARREKMQANLTFGKAQESKIEKVLTAKQITYLDNLNFQAEKYGFIEWRRQGNSGQGGQRQQIDQKELDARRKKMEQGRAELVKLNLSLIKILEK